MASHLLVNLRAVGEATRSGPLVSDFRLFTNRDTRGVALVPGGPPEGNSLLLSVHGDQADPPTAQGRDAPLRQGDELQGDSPPPVTGVHGEPVQVASPTVPRPAEGTHDLAIDLSHEECCGIVGDEPADAVHVVGHAGGKLRCSPQGEHSRYIVGSSGS
jgi:hypothetical protein